jgi:hypothetical protein
MTAAPLTTVPPCGPAETALVNATTDMEASRLARNGTSMTLSVIDSSEKPRRTIWPRSCHVKYFCTTLTHFISISGELGLSYYNKWRIMNRERRFRTHKDILLFS